MGELFRSVSIEDLPSDLIVEILMTGRLSAVDLVHFESTSETFLCSRIYPQRFRSLKHLPRYQSLGEFVASELCRCNMIYARMSEIAQLLLFRRCKRNWKRVLRFLQSVEQASEMVETTSGNMQITTGRYHTLLINNSSVYSCGSSSCGVLGHGPETTQCVAFTRIDFQTSSHVVQISASQNHAAFVTESGEVFTCGDNSSFCCGHGDTSRPIFRPTLVKALEGIPCKQVAAGLNFTVFLTREGQVYTCGSNTHGQLGHGDNLDRPAPEIVKGLERVGTVVQIAAGPSYVLAVTDSGAVYSFGSGSNFCLGHGEQHDEFQPRAIQKFVREEVHVVCVSAGDEHAVALDSSGFVYTWGKGYCGALGHGDLVDRTTPQFLESLWISRSVQVCARKRKTFVLVDDGSVYGFGWMGFGSLGFPDRGASDKVMKPRILECLRAHHVSQISTGLDHTVVVTSDGRIFGFGDNKRAQLGLDTLRGCFEPTEIFI